MGGLDRASKAGIAWEKEKKNKKEIEQKEALGFMEQQLTGYPSIDRPWLKYYSEEAKNVVIPAGTCGSWFMTKTGNALKIQPSTILAGRLHTEIFLKT